MSSRDNSQVGDAADFDDHGQDPADHRSHSIPDFIRDLKETADKLVRDGAPRGDVKLLSVALKELRYCFKVFRAYRHRR